MNSQIVNIILGNNVIDIGSDNVIVSIKILDNKKDILSTYSQQLILNINGFFVMSEDFTAQEVLPNFTSDIFPLSLTDNDICKLISNRFSGNVEIISTKNDISLNENTYKVYSTYGSTGTICANKNYIIDIENTKPLKSFIIIKNSYGIKITENPYKIEQEYELASVFTSFTYKLFLKNVDGKLLTNWVSI